MRYHTLGTTGLFVSQLCLGTMTFGKPARQYAAAGGLRQDEVDTIARRAFDAGINFIDTANVYSNGEAEEMVGRTLKTLGVARHDVVIATKLELQQETARTTAGPRVTTSCIRSKRA